MDKLKQAKKMIFEAIEKPVAVLAFIFSFTLIIYAHTFTNGFVSMDDYLFVTENPYIEGFTIDNLKHNFSHPTGGHFQPITQLTYMIDHLIGGLNPFIYHLTSLLIHLLNIALVYFLIIRLFKNKTTGFIVAFLFAIHPLSVETVCWTATRNGLVFTSFYLLALIMYVKYLKESFGIKYLLISFLLACISILSKSAGITIPFTLILVDLLYERKVTVRSIVEKLPFLALSVFGGLGAIWAARELGSMNINPLSFNLLDRFFIINSSFLLYILKIVFPIGLKNMYFLPGKTDSLLPFFFYISPVINIFLFVLAFLKRKSIKDAVFGFLFYLLTISIFLQFVQIGGTFASERYAYLPNIGIFIVVAIIFRTINEAQENANLQFSKILITLVIAGMSIFFAIQTWNRVKVWEDGETLFTDYIEKEPNYEYGYWARSGYYLRAGNFDAARKDIEKAVSISPFDVRCRYQHGFIRNLFMEYDSAIVDFNIAIAGDSLYAKAYKSRAYSRLKTGQYEQCIEDYEKALALDSELRDANCFFMRGNAKLQIGKYESAISDFDTAIELKYDTIYQIYYNRGNAKKNLNLFQEAIIDYSQAIANHSDYFEAYNNRGICSYYIKDYNAAISDFSKAIMLANEYADAYNNRGNAYYFIEDLENACNDWQQAYNLGYFKALTRINKYCN